MDTIRNYLETMFMRLPQTDDLEQLKIDILANMEDKYFELVASGSTENEAIGQVISEFGSIDEVLEEFGLAKEEETTNDFFEEEKRNENSPVLDEEGILDIIAEKRSVGMEIGFGIISCSMGVASFLSLFNGSFRFATLVGLLGMVILAIFGIILFILAGFQNNKLDYLNQPFVLTDAARVKVEDLKEQFSKTYIFSITVGVALCILSISPVLIATFLYGNDQNIHIGAALLLVISSFGVWLFIYAGLHQGTFNLLLTQGLHCQPTAEEVKKMKLISKIDSIFWPLATLAFFIWGFFLPGGFGVSWLIFPIGGIISQLWES